MWCQDRNGKGLCGTDYKRVCLTWCKKVVDTEQEEELGLFGIQGTGREDWLGCVCMLVCTESTVVKQLSANFWF